MKVFLYIAFFIISLCTGYYNTVEAETLSLTGNWKYQDTNAASDEFSERYSFTTGKRFEFTDAMSLDSSIRFNRAKDETLTRENLAPSVSYLINNDLFMFNLSGAANEEFNSKNAEKSNKSLAANLSSAWEMKQWIPQVGVNYNQSWQEDDHNPNLTNSENRSTGLNIQWGFLLSKLFYTYNLNENKNKVTGGSGNVSSHFARYQTSRSFWREKVSVNFSQQYNGSDNKNILPVNGGIALLPMSVAGFSGEVSSPAGNYSLATNSDLTDTDVTDRAVTTTHDVNYLNIGFKTNYQTVTTLYLYTSTNLSFAAHSAFSWDLYSSTANATWTLEKSGLSATYDSLNNRFVIDISGYTREYLGVVAATDAGAILVSFSEVEIYQEISASGSQTLVKNRTSSQQTDVNLSFKITNDLQLTSNLTYEQNNNSVGTDSHSTKVSNGINWFLADGMTLRANANFISRKRDNTPEDQTRSYGLSLEFLPLATVDTVLGVTLFELYESDQKLSESYNYNLQMVARLYEDLDARLDATFTQSDDNVTGSKSNNTSARMHLTARLIPGLVATLSSNYSKSSGATADVESTVNLHWRLSEMLAVTSTYSQAWTSSESASMSTGFELALTRNMQISFMYGRSIRPDSSQTTSLNWKWTISKYISMITTGSYQDGYGGEAWSVMNQLSTRFSLM